MFFEMIIYQKRNDSIIFIILKRPGDKLLLVVKLLNNKNECWQVITSRLKIMEII